jgi:predicted type IV restriction endonuclease
MDLKQTIEFISKSIKQGRFTNEASVSQGIVLRLLSILGWNTFDTEIVIPEYSIQGRRVDFALCQPRNKPVVFIEVKKIGQAEGSEKQLFEYAFHQGIPFAILTDGQEWHFFLPGEQGPYKERRVYRLDILERDLDESCKRFTRYLDYKRITNGQAIESARHDYQNASKQREIRDTIPVAWSKLIDEKDEILLELLSDKVESLCGYKPELDIIEAFFERLTSSTDYRSEENEQTYIKRNLEENKTTNAIIQIGFTYKMKTYSSNNARGVMIEIFKIFDNEDNTFFERFASRPKHGGKRRYLAKNKYNLYPGRPDLSEKNSYVLEIVPGWWLGLNYSKETIEKIIKMACEVKGVSYGSELIIFL